MTVSDGLFEASYTYIGTDWCKPLAGVGSINCTFELTVSEGI